MSYNNNTNNGSSNNAIKINKNSNNGSCNNDSNNNAIKSNKNNNNDSSKRLMKNYPDVFVATPQPRS